MYDLVISDPNIMMGKPLIRGTRITVELILQKLASGQSIDDIIENYPKITKEAVYAACEFAAKILKADVVYPYEAI